MLALLPGILCLLSRRKLGAAAILDLQEERFYMEYSTAGAIYITKIAGKRED